MIEFNKCYFIDCLDLEKGLPKLAELIECGEIEQIDLGFTDPIWGVNIDNRLQTERLYQGRILKKIEHKIYYRDDFNPDWNLEWFHLLQIICKRIILVIGNKVKFWWIRNTNPIGEIIINMNNGYSMTKIASHSHYATYLCYGEFKSKLTVDVIDYTNPWGFLSKEKQIIHPTPKGTEIPLRIFIELQPKSIIDPFSGSGSYPYSAHLLNIPWIAYEINPIYQKDYQYRFSQKTLGKFVPVLKRVKKKQHKRKSKKSFIKKQTKLNPQKPLTAYTEGSGN